MRLKRSVIAILLVSNLFLFACVYIVLPEGLDTSSAKESQGWSAVVTGVGQSAAGDLHIDLTLRNETADWSVMRAVDEKPASLTSGGKTTPCETVFVGTGGHRLAPGFQMRGYVTGSKAEPKTQLIYVECKGVQAAEGAKLSINYLYFTGPLDYYHQDDGKKDGTLVLKLDEVATDLTYPVYQAVDGVIFAPDTRITAISDNVISLLDVQRSDAGLEFKWQNDNPTEFALKTHIGNPPVIGSDGIIYGIYEIMDIASVPITPAKGSAQWSTKTAMPPEVKNPYILLSVESRQMRFYVNYALDITSK